MHTIVLMTESPSADQSTAVQDAEADIQQLRLVNLPDDKIALMLSRRHPADVLRHLMPRVKIPEATPSLLVGRRTPINRPTGVAVVSQAKNAEAPTSPDVARDGTDADLRFLYTPLIQCTFPHSDPGDGVTTYTRRNGRLEVSIVGKSGVGLPYGVPARLLSIYVTSEIKRTKSRQVLLGRSFADFLRRLELPVTGGVRGTTTMYRDQINRLVRTFFTIDESVSDESVTRLDIRNARFCSNASVWWDKNYQAGTCAALEISDEMYDSMIERSAPLSNKAIRALRRSPLDLDIYAWLVYRLYRLNRPAALITWDDFSAQTGQSYARTRDFRTQVGNSLQRVLKQYPEARVEVMKEGLRLQRSPRHIAAA